MNATPEFSEHVAHLNALTISIYEYLKQSGIDHTEDFQYNRQIGESLASANLPCVSAMKKDEALKLRQDVGPITFARYVFLPINRTKDWLDWQFVVIDGLFPGKVPTAAVAAHAKKYADLSITETEINMADFVALLDAIQTSKKAELRTSANAAQSSAVTKN